MHHLIIISCLTFISCGFYSLAGSIPPHIKSISIPLLENQTAEFGLAESITDGIIDQFNGAGILLLEDSDAANSILSGKIIKVTDCLLYTSPSPRDVP